MKKKIILGIVIVCALVLGLFAYRAAETKSAEAAENTLVSGGEGTHLWRAYGTVVAENAADKSITARVDPEKCYKIESEQVTLDCSELDETFASSANFSFNTGESIAFEYFIWNEEADTIKVSSVAKKLEASGVVDEKDLSNKVLTTRIDENTAVPISGRRISVYCNQADFDMDSVNAGDTISFDYYEDAIINNNEVYPVEIKTEDANAVSPVA